MFVTSLIKIVIATIGIIIGAALIGMGIGYYNMNEGLLKLANDAKIPNPKIIFIILGVVILLISATGFLAIVLDNIIVKIVLCVVLGLLIIVLVILAIAVFYNKTEFMDRSTQSFDMMWKKRLTTFKQTIILIQKHLECCGSAGPSDYTLGLIIPVSCCEDLVGDKCLITHAYQDGCREKIQDVIKSKINWLGAIFIIAAIILLVFLVSVVT